MRITKGYLVLKATIRIAQKITYVLAALIGGVLANINTTNIADVLLIVGFVAYCVAIEVLVKVTTEKIEPQGCYTYKDKEGNTCIDKVNIPSAIEKLYLLEHEGRE